MISYSYYICIDFVCIYLAFYGTTVIISKYWICCEFPNFCWPLRRKLSDTRQTCCGNRPSFANYQLVVSVLMCELFLQKPNFHFCHSRRRLNSVCIILVYTNRRVFKQHLPDDKIIPKIARNFLRCLAYTEPNGGVDLREIMTMEQKKKESRRNLCSKCSLLKGGSTKEDKSWLY